VTTSTVANRAASAKPVPQERPGFKVGQVQEFTLISRLKPGGAERVRQFHRGGWTGERQTITDRLGTVHDLRFIIFDNDTRIMFASTFDGTWDAYIDDFATKVPNEIDLLFHEFEGYPGVRSPEIKDWIVKQQVTATTFYSAYPDTTVRDVWKALKTKTALDALLDQA
jgi:hypothetical protein